MDIEVRRGNNTLTVRWVLSDENGAPLPFVGRTFLLIIRCGGRSLRKDTTQNDGFVADASDSSLTWTPSLAESRLIPLGRLTRYEIEYRAGGLQGFVTEGFISGLRSLHDD